MIKRLNRLLSEEKYKKMVSNFSYLAIINVANKFLPLLVIPYIIRTIGVEKYGVIVFASAIIMYFQILVRYSFDLTATKYISYHRDHINKLSHYFWNVMATIILLFFFGLIIFLIIVFSYEQFYLEKEVFLFSFVFVLANALVPMWFFQGIEEMKYIAIFNIISKILYTVTIFIFIQEESDYIWIPLLNSLSFLFVGIYAIIFIWKKYHIQFKIPSSVKILELLKEGKDIFFSNMSVTFYTTTNTVLLGLLTNYTIVGIYGLADTLFSAYSQIIKTYSTVIYPYLVRFSNKKEELYTQAKKFFFLYIVILITGSVFLFMISELTIEILFGEGHDKSILVLQILAVSLLLEPLGGFFTRYLAIKEEYKTIKIITFQTMIINFIIIIPLILLYEEIGVALAFIILSVIQVILNLNKNRELIRW